MSASQNKCVTCKSKTHNQKQLIVILMLIILIDLAKKVFHQLKLGQLPGKDVTKDLIGGSPNSLNLRAFQWLTILILVV